MTSLSRLSDSTIVDTTLIVVVDSECKLKSSSLAQSNISVDLMMEGLQLMWLNLSAPRVPNLQCFPFHLVVCRVRSSICGSAHFKLVRVHNSQVVRTAVTAKELLHQWESGPRKA